MVLSARAHSYVNKSLIMRYTGWLADDTAKILESMLAEESLVRYTRYAGNREFEYYTVQGSEIHEEWEKRQKRKSRVVE